MLLFESFITKLYALMIRSKHCGMLWYNIFWHILTCFDIQTLNLVFLPLVLNICRMWSTELSATNRKYDHQWQRGPEWGVAVASVSAIQLLWPHLWREHYPPWLGTDCRPLCWLGHSCIVSTCHRVVSVYYIKKCCQHIIGGNVIYTHTYIFNSKYHGPL